MIFILIRSRKIARWLLVTYIRSEYDNGMILGIDETGTFSLESPTLNLLRWYIFLKPSDQKKLATHLAQWKKRYKQRATVNRTNKNGEVKGSDLSDDELADFVNHVIRRQGQYFYISICAIVPN